MLGATPDIAFAKLEPIILLNFVSSQPAPLSQFALGKVSFFAACAESESITTSVGSVLNSFTNSRVEMTLLPGGAFEGVAP